VLKAPRVLPTRAAERVGPPGRRWTNPPSWSISSRSGRRMGERRAARCSEASVRRRCARERMLRA
jgi:hypothetical protein